MSPVIQLLAPGSVENSLLTYVIMGARYRKQWLFVRHHARQTWELPAGHIEPGEDPDKAALRELWEETGAVNPSLNVLSDYEVRDGGKSIYGRFYYAGVEELQALPGYEIEEILLSTELPLLLTYPEVQTRLFSLLTLL